MNDPKMMEVMATMQREHAVQVADLEMKLVQAQHGGGELPQDERYASCVATIRDLDRIGMQFAADLIALHSVEGSCRSDLDYLRRDDVLKLVTAWRTAWDQNSAQRMPIDRAALAQRAASVTAQVGQMLPQGVTIRSFQAAHNKAWWIEIRHPAGSTSKECVQGRDVELAQRFAAPVPAASVQPDDECQACKGSRVPGMVRGVRCSKCNGTQVAQPDIGRDAALALSLPTCQCFTEQQEQYCIRQRKCAGKATAYNATQAAPEQKGGM